MKLINIIELVSNQPHMKFTLYKRHINFRDQVFKSSKNILKHLFSICMYDSNSVTGSNLRKIMLQCDSTSVVDMKCDDVDNLVYADLPMTEKWRVGVIWELMQTRLDNVEVPGFTKDDISDILNFVCIT